MPFAAGRTCCSAESSRPRRCAAPSLGGLKVLVVDDEEDAREIFSAVLVQQGAEVVFTPAELTAVVAALARRAARGEGE